MQLFTVYKEPVDLYLMINDYLETTQKDTTDNPTLPGLLVHLNITKKQMEDLLELNDEFAQVMSM